jgi:tRNA dimethylallyltransferase
VAVVGPTASGKTELAIELATRLGGELVSADSRQVFVGCDIGTNKPSAVELRGIACHGLDLVQPGHRFTVADYRRFSVPAIEGIAHRGRTPILQGGSGLYFRAILDGWNLADVPADWALRERLEARLKQEGREGMEAELRSIDPVAAVRAQHNPRRLVRALEIHALTGAPPSTVRRSVPPPWRTLVLGIEVPLEELDRRIERRVDRMLTDGLLEEVRGLRTRHSQADLTGLGHGYREMGAVLDGTMTIDDARASTIQQVRRYARRQLTWFRADHRVRWLDPDAERVGRLAERFLSEDQRDRLGPPL